MGLKSALFGSKGKGGKSSSSTESGNHAYGAISGAFTPALNYVTGAGNMMSSLLGLGGSGQQTTALNNFANSGGMNFLKEQGMDMITSNQAAKGLLNSGDTLKASQQYGQGLASTYLNQFMQNLLGLGGLGLGAGGVMADAGRWSKGESQSTGPTQGKSGMLPQLISAAAGIPGISDRRLKSDIVHVSTAEDGLKIYDYTINGVRKTGPMADEVAKLRPWAYLPGYFDGYDGVDYAKIGSYK